MDVGARLDVVNQVPALMVGIVIDNKVVTAAVPAPIRRETPIPGRNFERKATREEEPVVIAIKSLDVITI